MTWNDSCLDAPQWWLIPHQLRPLSSTNGLFCRYRYASLVHLGRCPSGVNVVDCAANEIRSARGQSATESAEEIIVGTTVTVSCGIRRLRMMSGVIYGGTEKSSPVVSTFFTLTTGNQILGDNKLFEHIQSSAMLLRYTRCYRNGNTVNDFSTFFLCLSGKKCTARFPLLITLRLHVMQRTVFRKSFCP